MNGQKIIELKDAIIYQGSNLILSNLDITILKGEFVYLVGKTGMGKSSLLKVLYGDLKLAGGFGMVAGNDLNEMNWKKLPFLRRHLGIVFQDFQLLTDRSVDANLNFVLNATGWEDKQAMADRVKEVLDMVGLGSKGYKMPFELSGGEQQRVVIARALLNHPELILADEPTGNLDPETSDEIIRLLISISEKANTAVLMASHDFLTIQKFPARTLTCEGGRVIDSQKTVSESV